MPSDVRVNEFKFYIYGGAMWLPHFKSVVAPRESRLAMDGPFCLSCRTKLDVGQDLIQALCPNITCKREHELVMSAIDLRGVVLKAYEAKQREGYEVEALDLPPGKVSAKDEDENYWVEANIGQHRGKKMAVIYIGDKSKRGEKTQLFIDLEDEQVRFDSKGDRHPTDVSSRITVDFRKSKTKISEH